MKDLGELGNVDLIVGADGVNSLVRRSNENRFGASVRLLTNRFAWFGTSKRFETLTQTFVETDAGSFNAHHYRYSPDLSTFIVEVDQSTFKRAGFAQMGEAETRAFCERVFAQTLDGSPLVSNNSVWRQFPIVHNEHWSVDNCVLVGDALHTAHFSIGSGTRLAMEDAIALDRALAHSDNIGAALVAYEAARRPTLEKTGVGCQWQRDLVRAFCRAYAACAGRFRDELHHTFRSSRHRTVAKTFSALRRPIRARWFARADATG